MNRRQERQSRPAKRHLSELQKAVMKWLYTDGRRQRRMGHAAEVTFPALIQAMGADKLSVVTGLRQLMRKGLVEVSLPRGAWNRMVKLTEQGEEQAHSLVKAEQPKLPRPEPDRRHRQRREKRGRGAGSGKSSKRMYRR